MDEATREALEASIAHWKDVAQAADPRTTVIGCSSCALCTLFRRDGCIGCPVMAHTGRDLCKKTPYGAVLRAFLISTVVPRIKGTAFRAAARAEIEFLESLRDPPAA